jgi:hypothetical protein
MDLLKGLKVLDHNMVVKRLDWEIEETSYRQPGELRNVDAVIDEEIARHKQLIADPSSDRKQVLGSWHYIKLSEAAKELRRQISEYAAAAYAELSKRELSPTQRKILEAQWQGKGIDLKKVALGLNERKRRELMRNLGRLKPGFQTGRRRGEVEELPWIKPLARKVSLHANKAEEHWYGRRIGWL